MKKILLIIALTLIIFQLVVLAIAIDIGSSAINRGDAASSGYTMICYDNPANEDGKITSIEIWANENLSNCQVATFFVVSGNYLSTRDTHTIGDVTAGSKQTFSGLDITVEAGDYVGIYYTSGKLERDTSGGTGVWYKSGDHIPCINEEFDGVPGTRIQSLYGIGTTIGWDHKWNTQTISKWNTKEIMKWNDLE